MSRCWPVNRRAFGRLARYSRNLSSGLCDTSTAGSTGGILNCNDDNPTIILATGPRAGKHNRPDDCRRAVWMVRSVAVHPFQEPVEGGVPFGRRVIDAGGNFAADALHQFLANHRFFFLPA